MYLAVFGRSEQRLAIVEVLVQDLGCWRWNFPCLSGLQGDIFNLPLFVLILVKCSQSGPGDFQVASNALRKLPSQHRPPLFLDEAGFGESGLTDNLLETLTVELSVGTPE